MEPNDPNNPKPDYGVRYLLLVISPILAIVLIRRVNWELLDWNMLLQYINSLKWVIIVLILIFMTRRKIPGLFDRLQSLQWKDKSAKFSPHDQTEKIEPHSTQGVEEIGPEELQDESSTTDVEELKKQLGIARVELDFERINRLIFGTQINALMLLRSYPHGLQSNDLEPILQEHKSYTTNPYENVIKFMEFLSRTGLVEYNQQSGAYILTQKGDVYLQYREVNGLTDIPRPY